jgi:hypothetical protein
MFLGLVLLGTAALHVAAPATLIAAGAQVDRTFRELTGGLRMSEPAKARIRKCATGSTIQYGTMPCAPGSKEAPMDGGTLTVMPAVKDQATPAPGMAASIPNVRDLLVPPSDIDLRAKQIERAINP